LCLALLLASASLHADVVAVVSAKSPITALTKSQVGELFLGKTLRFPNGTLAVPIDHDEGTPARNEFYAAFAGKTATQVKEHWAKIIFTGRGEPPRTVSSDADVKKLLAANPDAIAYLERSAVDTSVRVVAEP
jgi:hypothetical protein